MDQYNNLITMLFSMAWNDPRFAGDFGVGLRQLCKEIGLDPGEAQSGAKENENQANEQAKPAEIVH